MTLLHVRRDSIPSGAWNLYVDGHPDGWFFHTEEFIAYASAYAPGSTDLSSCYLAVEGETYRLVGVIARIWDSPSFGGQPLPEPILETDIEITYDRDPPDRFVLPVVGRPGKKLFGIAGIGMTHRLGSTLVVDLGREESEIWKDVRKSYRSLIHRAEREYDIDVYSGNGVDDDKASWRMQKAKATHAEAAGRVTRSDETWNHQRDWLRDGRAILVSASKAGEMRGFVYVVRYKDWAYYFSAAALDESLQHALVWQAICVLRCDGATKSLELGHDLGANATEKDKQINFFLSGFGGTPLPVEMLVRAEA